MHDLPQPFSPYRSPNEFPPANLDLISDFSYNLLPILDWSLSIYSLYSFVFDLYHLGLIIFLLSYSFNVFKWNGALSRSGYNSESKSIN